MVSIPEKTSIEFIDGLLAVVAKFEETLIAARSFVLTNNDLVADGGDPFEAVYPDAEEEKVSVPFENGDPKSSLLTKADPVPVEKWVRNVNADLAEMAEGDRFASEERATVVPEVVKKRRAKPVRRTSVTTELRAKILDALLNRNPRPRMVDIATEFEVSQSTISRLWGIHQSENPQIYEKVPAPSIVAQDESTHVPLPGQLILPIISEGRKPGLED